jgi:NAD(P)-dependent dehydrogenase (short-subunit alcohol dehydrogenase family)
VNVSSLVGSIAQKLNPELPSYDLQYVQYRASKAALNMVTAWLVYRTDIPKECRADKLTVRYGNTATMVSESSRIVLG